MLSKHSSLMICTLMSLTLMMTGCAGGEFDAQDAETVEALDVEELTTNGVNADGRTVENMIFGACSTTSVKGLSQQLVEEINCLSPGTMSRFPEHPRLDLGDAVFPYLQTSAANALQRTLDSRQSTMYVNSALRTLPQQLLLRKWYENRRCNIGLAARPGTSNHEDGLALDIQNYDTWRSALNGRGYSWFGGSDVVHFDYVAGGKNLGSLSVLAFQKLWNRNNPNDRIAEDGGYGAQTESRLRRAPVVGFRQGASCGNTLTPEMELAPIEVYWYRQADGSYKLRALAPSHVARVVYSVDGYDIAEATRADGANFPDTYTFSDERRERTFLVKGYDAQNREVALGTGLIDVVDDYGVYIRQLSAHTYAIGIERAPEGVAHIEVEADGYTLGHSAPGKLEVRPYFNQLGKREFTLRTYNEDGSLRGTLRRTFELR